MYNSSFVNDPRAGDMLWTSIACYREIAHEPELSNMENVTVVLFEEISAISFIFNNVHHDQLATISKDLPLGQLFPTH